MKKAIKNNLHKAHKILIRINFELILNKFYMIYNIKLNIFYNKK